ncbi:unnamed protein product [Dicrocoelium dendriticum]|nr:unnamed protein product [Dicrocoelium dendriticum]
MCHLLCQLFVAPTTRLAIIFVAYGSSHLTSSSDGIINVLGRFPIFWILVKDNIFSSISQPEPFFVTMFLVNTADGRRVSEDFHWNPNTPLVDAMIPPELFRQLAWTNASVQLDAKNCSVEVKSFVNTPHSPTDRTRVQRPHRGSAPAPPFSTISLIRTPLGVQTTLETSLWNHCRSALFSIPTSIPSPASVYLVVRVDKVLNGSTGAAVEKYLKAVNTSSASALFVDDKTTGETESKSSSAIHRSMLTYCRHLGRYRMPFAWGARCLTSRTSLIPLFKMDSSKMSESLFIQSVQQMARLLESSSPSAVSKLPMGASASSEKRGLPSDGAPILPGPNEGATKDDSWYCELIERYLKTQLLPIRLEVGISELIDAYEGPSIYDSNLVTPDLLPLTPNHSASDPTRAIPPSHPTLRPNELIREVEHMWDFGTIMLHNPASESGPGVVSDSDFVLFANPTSGSLHRATQLNTLMGSTGTRSNRDSLISSSSTGSSIQLDAARNPQSAAQSRTNSLDRPTYRPSGETIGRPTTPISPELVPFTTFLNSLYVYPKFLNMAVKHGFPRARNLSCFMELRCSDDLQLSSALQVFFSRPSMRQIPFDSWCNTAVIYHEAAPHFMDNFKLCLPLHLTPQHHLLFRFYHVSVDTAGSLSAKDKPMGKKPLESSTGYAWLPILGSDGNTAGIPIRNAPRRGGGTRELRGASERSSQFPDPIVENGVMHQQERPEAASSLTSSTLTLTELGDVCGSMDNGQTGMLNGAFASNRNKHLDPDRMDGIRLADDLYDTTDQDWGNQVLSLVGVLSVAPQTRPTSVATQWMSSNGTAAAEDSTITSVTSEHAGTAQPHQHRLPIGPHPGASAGLRRLTDKLQRELFICLLHILSTVTDDHVIALYKNFTIQERVNFLLMLNYAIQHLQYRGKQCIQKYEHISRSRVAVGRPPLPIHSQLTKRSGSAAGRTAENNVYTSGTTEDLKENGASEITDYKILLEANLATESGLIVLDLLHIFSSVFRSDLQSSKPDDPMFKGILEVYIALLSHNPSDYLIRHTFAALRVFIGRFAKVLFSQSTDVLNAVCLTSLRWANESSSRALESESTPPLADESVPLNDAVAQIRADSCSFLYKLWKCSYESFGAAGFHRVHLQTIISVSKLVSEIGPGFDCSLNLLHSLVDTDMRGSYTATNSDSKFWLFGNNRQLFADEVDDLIRRIRTVLAATAEMRQHSDDHERLVDLHYFLAKSYSSNPALRRTWLEELAKLHMSTKSLAELAMTKLHIAALMVEYLRRRGDFPHSCDDFTAISSNICQEENGLRTDSALLEIPYSQDVLLTDINEAAATLEAAGLFEAIRPVYNLVLPVYEARQDYTALAQVYRHIGRAYESTGIAEASGHRLFAAYFRVIFHGSLFKTLNGKSFVYRTNACQKLNTMCSELLTRYSKKYGPDAVDLCVDYAFNQDTADQNKAYIQVTYVEPYKPTTQSTNSLSSYARHHDVRQFMFETPFILLPGLSATASLLASGPKRSEDLTLQWKRRTVVTTEASFPHLRRRLEVVDVSETDLSPIDAAIDAISCKNHELRSHVKTISNLSLTASSNTGDSSDCSSERVTVTSIGIRSPVNCAAANWSGGRANSDSRDVHCIPLIMDMQLQGALLPTVNAGPMAYAEAFLKAEHQSLYPADKVAHLRDLFFEFLTLCLVLLTHYHRLMSSAHEAKYHAMRQALDRYRVDLSNLLKVEITVDEKRLVIGPRSTSVSDLTASIISAASEC